MAASTTLPNHSSTRHSFSADAWENLLFVFLLGIYLVPIWWFPYFPSQDGPGHLYNAYLLSGWSNSSFPIDRSFFAFNPAPVPNWLGSVLLALLIKITTPLRAEKLALTLYVVFLPVAMRYGARSVRSDARYLYFLAFAFVYNWFFHLGMLNFCISLAWYLLFIGYWIRNRDHLHARQMFVLLAITVPFYFSNGLSYYMALGAVGVLSVAYGLREFDRATWKQWCINILKPQIGLLLAIPLTLSYLALHGRNYHPSGLVPETPMTWKDVIWSLSRLTALMMSFTNQSTSPLGMSIGSDSSTQVYFSILPSESGARNEPAATTRLTPPIHFKSYKVGCICNPERERVNFVKSFLLTFLLFQGFPPSAKVANFLNEYSVCLK